MMDPLLRIHHEDYRRVKVYSPLDDRLVQDLEHVLERKHVSSVAAGFCSCKKPVPQHAPDAPIDVGDNHVDMLNAGMAFGFCESIYLQLKQKALCYGSDFGKDTILEIEHCLRRFKRRFANPNASEPTPKAWITDYVLRLHRYVDRLQLEVDGAVRAGRRKNSLYCLH